VPRRAVSPLSHIPAVNGCCWILVGVFFRTDVWQQLQRWHAAPAKVPTFIDGTPSTLTVSDAFGDRGLFRPRFPPSITHVTQPFGNIMSVVMGGKRVPRSWLSPPMTTTIMMASALFLDAAASMNWAAIIPIMSLRFHWLIVGSACACEFLVATVVEFWIHCFYRNAKPESECIVRTRFADFSAPVGSWCG